ncbi:Rv1355c family protein [Mycobacterium cookii]|uniref:Rv1355c family protein n=1 Tax=Mycobacterium cookii TaxID=1775 RepID=UPI003558FFF5
MTSPNGEAAIAEFAALILDAGNPADKLTLEQLRADPVVEFVDESANQIAELRGLLPPPSAELVDEPCRWAYYPWRRTVVAVLGPRGFRATRLDRNRNVVTADEQARLGALKIGVAGLSAGHVIAHSLAAQGLCGELRLADFDHLELTNLNRVPATVFDIGLNKAEAAARRIAELDPYLSVTIMNGGLTLDNIDDFLDGLNIVVEECDSLDMKATVRERARARGIPVLMATSDRGLVDVERFDLEPGRPIMHGLLGDADPASLSRMTSRDKVPLLLRFLEAKDMSARGAASLLEIDHTLSTWPQVFGDVAAGAPVIAEAVRRIGLGEHLPSGRTRLDIGGALDRVREPELPEEHDEEADTYSDPVFPDAAGRIVAAAIRAPSGGNSQPWRIDADADRIAIHLVPEHSSMMDIGYRGSAVALGAALFNARAAAAALQLLGPVAFTEDPTSNAGPLQVTLQLGDGADAQLAALYEGALGRETNRHVGAAQPIADDTARFLRDAAEREGAHLHLLTERADIDRLATILAASDRARYLTADLHAEMISELRWPGDPSPDTGIDIRSLEMAPGDLAVVDILRRPDVMANLARWNAGSALGEDTRRSVSASSVMAIISVAGDSLTDYARGGCAVEAVWITAQQQGLAVAPISPIFLYARSAADLVEVSPAFSDDLLNLQDEFERLAGIATGGAAVLVLRLANAEPATVRSRRDPGRVYLR